MTHRAHEQHGKIVSTMRRLTVVTGGVRFGRCLVARSLVVLIPVIVLMVGCGSGSEESPGVSGSTDVSPYVSRGEPVAPAEVQPQQLQVPPGADPKWVLEELNRELRRWVMRNRRTPSSFEEFVTSAQMQVPAPPVGKKYVLTRQMRIEMEPR